MAIVMINESLAMNVGAVRTDSPRQRWFSNAPATLIALGAIMLVGVLVLLDRLAVVDGIIGALAVAAMALAATQLASARSAETAPDAGDTQIGAGVEKFAETLTEPCMIVNDRVVLVYCNTATRTLFPRAKAGDPLAFTLRDPDLVEAIDKARETGQNQAIELHMTLPNDTWFRASITPYTPGNDEDRTFIVITLYDFTEQKRTDRMRGDFIANASHELRTPLTSLMGFIDTLQGPAARDEVARTRFLGIMRAQSERMSGLIDDLLSLSRIELRQHVKPTAEVNINHLIREVAESLEPRLKASGLSLRLDLPDMPVKVMGDRQELFEAIENLADNAIKYGEGGEHIEIVVTPGASRSGTHHAITIVDFGAGISEEHVPRLTERFYRVDAESSRKKKGTGLGLAIVKHIVHRHHGELNIRSKLGQGTRVEILLPGM